MAGASKGATLGARTGGIADIINSASNAFTGAASSMANKATLARQKWSDLFDVTKQRVSDSNSGSGSGVTGLGDIFPDNQIPEEPVNNEPTEPQPIVDMTGKDPNINWRSPGGQWEYNWQYMAWIPVGADVVE